MPYSRETSIVGSEITGNVTSTSFMWRNCTFSLMVRSQAMWLNVLSIERPPSSQLRARNSPCMDANVRNSVVQSPRLEV
ncbi:MAG: hypothetical protein WBL65_00630 [Bryobacteraceae bacterium]